MWSRKEKQNRQKGKSDKIAEQEIRRMRQAERYIYIYIQYICI